jgi:lipoprotein-anchoring transpeptidase ErfK/SrfK
MMIKRILTLCTAVAAGAAGISLAQAQQGYPVAPGNVYSSAPSSYPSNSPYQGGSYSSDYRRGVPGTAVPGGQVPGGQDFDQLDDDDAAPGNTAALPPPGSVPPGPVMSPDDPRYGRPAGAPVYSDRGVPTGPILSPDDPRYGRPAGTPPVYSDRGAPTGPILSPDDPRYGRPSGPPPVIYGGDRPAGAPQQTYVDRYGDPAPRPPEGMVVPPGSVGSAQPPAAGPDGKPMTVAALPPEEQPDAAPAQLSPNLRRQEVSFVTKEPAGTIVVDTPNTYLYYVLGGGRAVRYGVRVGREGFTWTGVQKISKKTEWPDWFPPTEMIERQPYLPRFMAGGPGNPLGARAMYLGSTVYRIHGTNQPSTIGKFVSSGCIGMLNEDVSDLFARVKVGTRVVVLPGGPPPGTATASARGVPGTTTAAAAPAPAAPTQMSNAPGPVTQPTAVPPLPAPVTIR